MLSVTRGDPMNYKCNMPAKCALNFHRQVLSPSVSGRRPAASCQLVRLCYFVIGTWATCFSVRDHVETRASIYDREKNRKTFFVAPRKGVLSRIML